MAVPGSGGDLQRRKRDSRTAWSTALAGSITALMVMGAACSPGPPPPPTPIPTTTLAAAAASPLIVTATRPPLSPTILPTATPTALVVARTDGDGLSIRRTPSSTGERIKVWPEGTRMVPLGEEQQVDGMAWKRVRDPDGNEGWAAAQFLVDEATYATLPTPVPRPVATTAPPKPAAPTVAPTRAGPTATFPPLRPTFTPVPAAPPAPPKPAGATPTAPPKPAGPTPTPARI